MRISRFSRAQFCKFVVVFVLFAMCVLGVCNGQEDSSIAPMEETEKVALFSAIQGFVGKWWNGSDLYPDPCGWTPIQGVSCDMYNGLWYVTSLAVGPIYDNSLKCVPNAQFSHSLFELKHLRALTFYNCFTNPTTIPTSNWENLANTLETLEFRSNPGLTGSIPTSFGRLRGLNSLVLLENGLTGQVPSETGNLVNLQRLVVAGNRLVGPIPTTWGGLTGLLIVDLSRNSLIGSVPSTFGGLTSLLKLDLSSNFLEGVLPGEIGNLKNLTVLDLSHNNFSNGLSKPIQEMVSLRELALSHNPIGGDLGGIRWENLPKMEFLDLSNTGLIGEIPNSLTELRRLRFLGLTNNSLSGNVSPRFEAMPCIGAIYLNGNNFTGKLDFSEAFYRKMGSRFRASENPNLCYSSGSDVPKNFPLGVRLCENEESVLDSDFVNKMSDGDLHQDSPFGVDLGSSSSLGNRVLWGFRANDLVLFVLWIMLL